MKTYKAQVVVAGGGPVGVSAAIAAARNGADVLLIEQYGCLGGMSTVGGVAPWMTFHARDGKQTILGIGEEIVQKLVSLEASPGHVTDTVGESGSITPFDAEALKVVLAHMVTEAGVRILYHTFIYGVEKTDSRILAIKAANKDGEVRIEGDWFIDGTGDADLAAFSGCRFEKGENNNGKVQPATMNFTMANVDFDKVRRYMLENTGEFHFRTRFDLLEHELPNSVSGFFSLWKKCQEEITMDIQRDRFLFFRGCRDDVATVNTTRVLGIDSTDTDSLTKAELLGRQQAMEVAKAMKKHLPGFENAYLQSVASVIGIRESRRIIGEYVLTLDDLTAGRRFDDDICVYAYTVDRHDPTGNGIQTQDVTSYGIPYKSLLPREVINLMVGGRSISCDVLAQSAIRTTPGCFGMGQAAGTAAALAVKDNNRAFKDVDINKLRDTLIEQGVYL